MEALSLKPDPISTYAIHNSILVLRVHYCELTLLPKSGEGHYNVFSELRGKMEHQDEPDARTMSRAIFEQSSSHADYLRRGRSPQMQIRS